MPRLEKRRELLSRMPKGGICAEIGVWDGGFSDEILNIAEPRELHLIDPWSFQPEFNNSAFGRESHKDAMDEKYDQVCEKFRNDPRIIIHRAMSHEVLETFEDGFLDWVYIDGNHNYDVVSNDLTLCLQKVKLNGIISGDDLFWRKEKGAPVRTAVRETVRKLGESVNFSRLGQQYFLELNRA